jgi:hypothetical protein
MRMRMRMRMQMQMQTPDPIAAAAPTTAPDCIARQHPSAHPMPSIARPGRMVYTATHDKGAGEGL